MDVITILLLITVCLFGVAIVWLLHDKQKNGVTIQLNNNNNNLIKNIES